VTARLVCRDLMCGYGSIAVVRAFDVAVPAGTVVAVLGPNGAGKTTVMNTLAGLLPRIGGDVLVDSEPLPSGRPGAASQAGASAPITSDAVLAMFASTHDAAATVAVRQYSCTG